MLELLVLASVLQFEGGCCLLRNAPRTPGKDKPHGSSTVEHDTFFLGRTRSGLKIEQYSTGMYLNPAKKWVIEDQHHSGAQVPLSIAFWRALHGWYFYNILQTLVVARCFKPLIMYFIGDMSRTAGNQKYYGGSKTWCPSDYWTNMLVLDVHASLALGMHVKFLNTHTYTYTSIYLSINLSINLSIYLSINQSIYLPIYIYICDHMYICIGINL